MKIIENRAFISPAGPVCLAKANFVLNFMLSNHDEMSITRRLKAFLASFESAVVHVIGRPL